MTSPTAAWDSFLVHGLPVYTLYVYNPAGEGRIVGEVDICPPPAPPGIYRARRTTERRDFPSGNLQDALEWTADGVEAKLPPLTSEGLYNQGEPGYYDRLLSDGRPAKEAIPYRLAGGLGVHTGSAAGTRGVPL